MKPTEHEMAIKLATMQFCMENRETAEEIMERAALIHAWGGQEEVGPRALGVILLAAKAKRTPMLVVFAPPEYEGRGPEATVEDIQCAIDALTEYQNEQRTKIAAKVN